MRRRESPYDDKWAVARLHEVWEWAVAQKRPFVAYLIGMTILSFLRFEADTQAALQRIQDEFRSALKTIWPGLDTGF